MTQESIASALIDEMLADIGKSREDYGSSRADKSERSKERLLNAALEWVYDQGCATALAEFEAAAGAYTGSAISGD